MRAGVPVAQVLRPRRCVLMRPVCPTKQIQLILTNTTNESDAEHISGMKRSSVFPLFLEGFLCSESLRRYSGMLTCRKKR